MTTVAVIVCVLLAVALCSACVLAALYVVVSYGVWLIERRKAGGTTERAWPAELNTAAVGELLSTVYLLLSHPFSPPESPPPQIQAAEGNRPVILLYGFCGVRTNLALLSLRLRFMGRGPIYELDLYDWRRGVVEHAQAVSRFIDQVISSSGAAEVDVVAHSFAGVVARVAEARHGKRRVRRLVTLGAPHRGTELARLLSGEGAHDLRPGALLLSSLPSPPLGMVVSISSRSDGAVVPPENARIGEGGRDVVLDGVGHLAMLMDASVAEEVAKALGEDIRKGAKVLAPLPEDARALTVRL